MRAGAACLVLVACGGGSAAVDSGAVDSASDAARVDAPADAPPLCVTPTGSAGELQIPLVSGGLGVFDAELEQDPNGTRTWMVYSSVSPGPGDLRLVATRLGYSDDGGATFCDLGAINAPEATTPPSELSGLPAFWNHEVPALEHDPFAPAAQQWRLTWQRYLLVGTGDPATERRFEYSWLEERYAAAPTGLAAATEHKVLAGSGYALSADVQAYNDAVIGPPEVRVDQLDASLGDCVALAEPGTFGLLQSARWTALECAAVTASDSRIVLLADDRAGHWSFVARLLGAAEAQAINANANGFTAPTIFAPQSPTGALGLLATPTVNDVYAGCVGYALDSQGAVGSADFGHALPAGYDFGGACAYEHGMTTSGVVMGVVDTTASPLAFTLIATGQVP